MYHMPTMVILCVGYEETLFLTILCRLDVFCLVRSPSAVTEYKACEYITLRTWLSRSVTSRHVTLSRMQSALLEYASLEIQSKATRSVGTPSTSHIRYHTSVIIITPEKEKGTIYLGETGLYVISVRSKQGWANSRG